MKSSCREAVWFLLFIYVDGNKVPIFSPWKSISLKNKHAVEVDLGDSAIYCWWDVIGLRSTLLIHCERFVIVIINHGRRDIWFCSESLRRISRAACGSWNVSGAVQLIPKSRQRIQVLTADCLKPIHAVFSESNASQVQSRKRIDHYYQSDLASK